MVRVTPMRTLASSA